MKKWLAAAVWLTAGMAASAGLTPGNETNQGQALALPSPGDLCARWVESSWQDFSDGTVDNGMYVSRLMGRDCDSSAIEFVQRFDADNNGYVDVTTADFGGNGLKIYLADASGFSPSRVLQYTGCGSGNTTLSDLNCDGYPDLIQSAYNASSIMIFWGTPSGPSPSNHTALPGHQSEALAVCDLDKDGYLDIVEGAAWSVPTLYVYWGSASGYSPSNCTSVSLGTGVAQNFAIGDFDKDGWLDIACNCQANSSSPVVYWGPNRAPSRTVWLDYPGDACGHGLSTADLNKDGWLDLVYTGYSGAVSKIYWGSSSGFADGNSLTLHTGDAFGGARVYDLNSDGWLDIVFNRSSWVLPEVYYNLGHAPWFDDSHAQTIGNVTADASGGFIADFNRDGFADIFLDNTSSSSPVLWGPNFTTSTELPVNGDHHSSWREPGSVYDRSFSGAYLSSVYDAGPAHHVLFGTSSWVADEPGGSSVAVAFRSGKTPVPDSSWTDFFTMRRNGGILPIGCLGRRYLQYRVAFAYNNPCYLPDFRGISTSMVVWRRDVSEPIEAAQGVVQPATGSDMVFFSTSVSGRVNLALYDCFGHLVRHLISDAPYAPGSHVVPWDECDSRGRRVVPGTYFSIAEVTAEDRVAERQQRKLIVVGR